jgi:hypothetical protein
VKQSKSRPIQTSTTEAQATRHIKSRFAFNFSKLHQNSSHGFIIMLEIALSSCKEDKGIKQLLEAANGLRSR